EKLKLVSSIRVDKNQYFSPQVNYRFASVFSNSPELNFRVSYQNGYRFPSLFEAFSNVNSGGVKRVGGLRIMSDGIFENSYFKTSVDAFQAAVTAAVNTQGISVSEAITRNASLLKKNDYTYIQPEKVQSFEAGYKGYFLEKRLSFDIDFYYNRYRNFMAQVEVNIPKSLNPDSIAIYLNNRNTQNRYRLWTNSKATVHTYGSSTSLKYRFYRSFQIVGNVSYATLQRKDSGDGLEEAFNTPKWISNVALQNPDIFRNFGFSISYKYQTRYTWQSSLATGEVPAFRNLDLQLSYRVPKAKLSFKIASTNVLNRYYYNFLAGPSVGGFYYASITYN
ncbi:MAG TPA: TonB-dependent receptor, partial [Emticicia sp.]